MSGRTAADPAARLAAGLARLTPERSGVLVGFSGGPDSTLLLHLAAEIVPRRHLRALHVHHGWHPDADRWAAHCRAVAADLRVRCEVAAVDARPERGEGPEAAARAARYAAIRARLNPAEVLLTAHHRDDQAETLLLALLRGGGVHGWSGMPAQQPLGAGQHLRPWLEVARATLWAEIERRELAVLEDPANSNTDYDRAWLRAQILPRLRERYPGVDTTLARACGLAAEAAAGVDALAAGDYVAARGSRAGTLDCHALGRLPAARQRGLLRWWLAREGLSRPGAARLETLRHQLVTAAADRVPCVRWSGGEVRRWRGLAWALLPRTPIDPDSEYVWTHRECPLVVAGRTLEPELLTRLPRPVPTHSDVRVGFRRGGERLPRRDGRGSIALKRWLAACGVPPWERDRIPLLYVDGELVAALGVASP